MADNIKDQNQDKRAQADTNMKQGQQKGQDKGYENRQKGASVDDADKDSKKF